MARTRPTYPPEYKTELVRQGPSPDEKAEPKRLRAENRVLMTEKEILGKAAAFFAEKNPPESHQRQLELLGARCTTIRWVAEG